jgi:aspartate/glutamate racemase
MTFITRKKIGNILYGSMSNLNTSNPIQIVTTPEYRTNGEEFILVKEVPNSKIILDQSNTEHIVIKALTKVLIVPFMGLIDEQYDEILIDKGAAVEFFRVDGNWYILSSDGLKLE